jgi:hypothetical protein
MLKTGSQHVSRSKNARRGDSDPIQETNVGALCCLNDWEDAINKQHNCIEHNESDNRGIPYP